MPTNPYPRKKPVRNLLNLPPLVQVPWEKMSIEEQTIVGRMIDRRIPNLTPEKRQEACERYYEYLNILIRQAKHEVELDQRLIKEPDGFDPGPGYTCCYCPAPAAWHSKWKRTCDGCYAAFLIGRYPAFVATHPESFFKRRDIELDLGLTSKQVDKLIKRGLLVARCDIFLKKENPHLYRGPKPKCSNRAHSTERRGSNSR